MYARATAEQHPDRPAIIMAASAPRLATGKLYKRLLRDRYWNKAPADAI